MDKNLSFTRHANPEDYDKKAFELIEFQFQKRYEQIVNEQQLDLKDNKIVNSVMNEDKNDLYKRLTEEAYKGNHIDYISTGPNGQMNVMFKKIGDEPTKREGKFAHRAHPVDHK